MIISNFIAITGMNSKYILSLNSIEFKILTEKYLKFQFENILVVEFYKRRFCRREKQNLNKSFAKNMYRQPDTQDSENSSCWLFS